MAQLIKQGNIFGRVGSSIGQALAEQVPKEIERNRLSSGLENLNSQKNLSAQEYFTKALSVPGLIDRPQVIQSLENLSRQRARGEALAGQQQPKPSPFPERSVSPQEATNSNVPSLTKEDIFKKTQEGYIPPTISDRDAIAGDAYNKNPAFFGNDPQKAIEWADQNIAQEEKIANAYATKHGNLSKIQDNVVTRLEDQAKRLNTQVPAELYSKIEDEAIQATKPKSEGGRGLTEQQAMKEYADRLNDASRDFAKIDEVGSWGISLRPAKDSLRSMKEIQNKMESLDQTDNYAKKLIASNQLSPKLAYAIAQPVSKVPGLNATLSKLPNNELKNYKNPKLETLKVSPELAKFVKDNEKASPLAIAHELDKKGWDGSAFLEYVTDHANELNLRQRQSEQTSTPINLVAPWNDWWLSSFTGIE
jgi:hypothetical protein